MKKKMFMAYAFAVAVVSAPAFGACAIDVKTTSIDHGAHLSWAAVPGADDYYLERSTDSFRTVERKQLGANVTSIDVQRTTTLFPFTTVYRVVAVNERDASFGPCTGTASVHFIDTEFVRAVTRVTIPVVASTPGQGGANFKTALRLTAPTSLVGHGKIIFHPAGQQGSDADPSIDYAFSRDWETIEYDDIVAAFGRTGIGSIDIVPAPLNSDPTNRVGYVPLAEARLYNQTANGTYGANEHHVQPADFIVNYEVRAIVPDSRFRMNVGFRTFSTATINFNVYDASNNIRLQRSITVGPNFTLMQSPESLLNTTFVKGETISIAADPGGFAVPFYTYTDNGTNDPTIFMPELAVKTTIGPYDFPGIVSLK